MIVREPQRFYRAPPLGRGLVFDFLVVFFILVVDFDNCEGKQACFGRWNSSFVQGLTYGFLQMIVTVRSVNQ